MKITNIELIQTKKPIPLAGEYREAWFQPDGIPRTSHAVSYYKIHTDEGITGIGPGGALDDYVKRCLIGADPFKIEAFWHCAMRGLDVFARGFYGGIDIALWDIIGKAAGLPVYKLLGTSADKIKVYAATSRLLSPEEHVEQVQHIMSMGFKAVKLRFHRPDYRDDIKVAEAVRKACGDEIVIVIDANQNHRSTKYRHWSRETARYICAALQELGIYFFEEPLNRFDYEGLASLASEFDMYIAGGEHCMHIYEFKEHFKQSSYDIIQPDVILGDIGITGIRKLGHTAEFYNKLIIPHVCSLGPFPISFSACAAASLGLSNCPMIEFPYDPPLLTYESQQFYSHFQFKVDSDGYAALPQGPGLGIEIDEEALARYM